MAYPQQDDEEEQAAIRAAMDSDSTDEILSSEADSESADPPMDEMQVGNSFSIGVPPMRPITPREPPSDLLFSREDGDPAPPRAAPAPMPAPRSPPPSAPPRESGGGFDWARGLTAFSGGDVGALDRKRSEERDRPYVEAKQRYELAELDDAGQAKQRDRRMATARLDPMSPESQQARSEFSAQLKAYAQIPGITPGIQRELTATADASGKMSAAQMDRALANVHQLLGSALKGADVSARAARADQQQQYQNDMLDATRGNQAAIRSLEERKLKQGDQHFQAEIERKRAADLARSKANRIRLQMKRIDPKAQEELQALSSMDSDLKEVEQLLPGAYTGPGAKELTSGADVVESVTGALEKATGLPTTVKKPMALQNTQHIQSLVENAIADVRKFRFGSSLTAGESKALNEWKPGVQLSEQSNRNLISALRKHASFRAQGKVRQLFQNIGMPIHMPKDTYLPLDVLLDLKNEFDAMNQYDDESLADSENRVNEILAPFGGRVGAGRIPGGEAQRQPAAPARGGALTAPPGAPKGKVIKAPNGKRYRVSDDGRTMVEVQ